MSTVIRESGRTSKMTRIIRRVVRKADSHLRSVKVCSIEDKRLESYLEKNRKICSLKFREISKGKNCQKIISTDFFPPSFIEI